MVVAVSEVAEQFTPLGEIVHAPRVRLLWWAFMVEVSEVSRTKIIFRSGVPHAGFDWYFRTHAHRARGAGHCRQRRVTSSTFISTNQLCRSIATYVLMFQKHISTLIAIGGLFACGFGKDFYSDEQGIAFVLTTLAFVSGLIIDRNTRTLDPTLLDEIQTTAAAYDMGGPFMLFNIGIFVQSTATADSMRLTTMTNKSGKF